MDLKLSTTAEEFLSWYRKILEKYDAETQLFIVNLQNYAINGSLKENVMGGIYDQGELVMLFLNASPWNLQIFELKESKEACEKLAKFLVDNKIPISGINASFNIGLFFREVYSEQSGRLFQLRTAMDIMVLKKLKDIPLSAGSAELAKLKDADQLAEYLVRFNYDCFKQTHEKAEFMELVNKKITSETLYVFRDLEGRIVTICGVSPRTFKGMALNLVYTHPDFRNRGYCQTLVHWVCEQKLKSGSEYCTLFVDKTNPRSNRAYSKVGFEIVKDNYDYQLL